MGKLLSGAVATGIFMALSAHSADAAYERVYTELSDCQELDDPDFADAFTVNCEGPDKVAAALLYVDMRAAVLYGEAAGWFGNEVSKHAPHYGSTAEPRVTAVAPPVFGPRIEWTLAQGGRPCAATVRLNLDQGSRLSVVSLGGGGEAGLFATNEEAQAAAALACDEFGEAPPPRAFMQIEGERRQDEDRDSDFRYGEVRLEDNRLMQVSQFLDRDGCTINRCPVTVVIDGGTVVDGHLLCDVFDIHILPDGSLLRSCGEEISLVK